MKEWECICGSQFDFLSEIMNHVKENDCLRKRGRKLIIK